MPKTRATELICGLLILLFLYTAITKLENIDQFQQVLETSPLIQDLAGILAPAIPIIEAIIAALLFFPSTRQTGLYAGTVLLCAFTLYIIYMRYFSSYLPCSCGGVLRQLTWSGHILFNSAFILLSLAGLWLNRKTILMPESFLSIRKTV